MIKELLWTLRSIGRRPLPALLIVTALAIGLTAVIGVFTILKTVLLEPLPYERPDRIVRIWQELPLDSGPLRVGLSLEHMRLLQSSSSTLERIAAFTTPVLSLEGRGEPRPMAAAAVSPSLCAVLGVYPFLGRCFLPEEELDGHQFVAIVSHGLWRELYGEADALEGQTLQLSGRSYRIAGVLPQGFSFPGPETRIWVPAVVRSSSAGGRYEPTIARLKPVATIEQVEAEIGALLPDRRLLVRSVLEDMVADVRPRLLLVFGAVILVLGISCANVASILLSQSEARARDFAILSALGANTRRLLRRSFIEGFLYSAAAAGFATLIVHSLLTWFVAQIPLRIPRLERVAADGWVLLFSFLCAVLISVAFAGLPMLAAKTAGSLNGDSGWLAGRSRSRGIRRGILLGESVLLLALLNSFGLLAHSYYLIRGADPGFEAAKLIVFRIHTPSGPGWQGSRKQRLDSLIERLQLLPGVERTGVANTMPFAPGGSEATLFIAGAESPEPPVVDLTVAGGGFLRALGVRLLEGRLYDDTEADGRSSAVVSRSLALRHFGGSALGRELSFSASGARRRIVGVVDDVKHSSLNEGAPLMVYLPLAEQRNLESRLSVAYAAVRVSGETAKAVSIVRSEVEALGSEMRIEDFGLMEDRIWNSLTDRRFWTLLLGGVAALGLVLTIIGIYGLTAFSVAIRTKEIGLRMALGASPVRIVGALLVEVIAIAAVAIVPAWTVTQFSSRLLSGLLFGISPGDPIAFFAAWALLTVSAAAGCWSGAHPATRIEPAAALRREP